MMNDSTLSDSMRAYGRWRAVLYAVEPPLHPMLAGLVV